MQYTSIRDLQEAFKQNRFRYAREELDRFEELLKSAGSLRSKFLRWVFEEYVGFIETRKQAGLYYLHEHRDEALRIIENLIRSDNPDDRDTANEILQEINIPRSYELIRILLDDNYPYLQFDACDFLKEKYPIEVENTLLRLSNHEIKHVRDAANKRLQMLRASNH